LGSIRIISRTKREKEAMDIFNAKVVKVIMVYDASV
jgi:hypothetical protein